MLKRSPPILIKVAENDILREQGKAFEKNSMKLMLISLLSVLIALFMIGVC